MRKFVMKDTSESILYFDNSCKFCSTAKDFANKIEPKKVKYIPLNDNIIQSFRKKLHLSKELSQNVMFYKNKSGKISYGSEAFFAYLADRGGFYLLIALMNRFPLVKWFSERLYYCIAINRYKISSFLF